MALRYIDSMGDHYAAADANLKWTNASLVSRVTGLHGYALTGAFKKGLLFGSPTTIFEFYLYIDNFSDRLVTTYDSANNEQVRSDTSGDGSIAVRRFGTSSTWPTDVIGRTAPDVVRAKTWYHVGIKIFHHPSAGSVEIRLNGATVLNVTGTATVSQIAPSYWSGVVGSFLIGNSAGYNRFDDLVVMDDVDDGLNDPRLPGGGGYDKFLGPVIIQVKRPNAAGLVAEWTGVPTGPNWENVNDTDPDADVTINVATVTDVGASDLFNMEDLVPGEDVLAVQSLVLARKTDDGVAALAKLVRDGATTTPGATVYQPKTYSYMHAPEPTLPDGSLWTAAKWNAIQYGYRRIV